MHPWNCCRICLASQNLNPIFNDSENIEKLSNAITNAIGIKIDPKDNLSQQMCSTCIYFINDINKFRQKAVHSHNILMKRLECKHSEIKTESVDFKIENEIVASIDTLDIIVCDDFKDYEDNIIEDNTKYVDDVNESNENIQEYESTVNDIVEQELPIVFNGKEKKKVTKVKPVQRKLRSKKTEAELTRNGKKNGEKEEVECEYCHKVLTSKLSMRNHYKIHTGFDFVCEHCGKKFITKRLLLMHCRAKHGYEKTDKCSFCDYRASNAEQVKIHERLHTGERPYVCKECGSGFHRKSSYLQHVAIHLPEKTVQCDQCPATFKSVTLMRIHKSRHRLPAYRYRCGVCGNNFARRRNVARHLQRVHAQLQPDPDNIQRDRIS